MLTKRHTSTKAGQKKDQDKGLFYRLIILVQKLIRITPKTHRLKAKQNLHNADYHLSATQMSRILEAASSQRDRVILEILAGTGMRRSEIAAIDIEDIRWQESLVLVRHGKGNKMRLVPFTDYLKNNIKLFIGQRESGPVFLSQKGCVLSPRQINRIVAAAGKKAGIRNPNPKYKDITPHLFRHSFARLWKDKGGDIEALSGILGHSSVKTTWDLYGKMSMSDIQKNYQHVMQERRLKREINIASDISLEENQTQKDASESNGGSIT